MKIFEFTQNDSELKLNFDSIEDLVIYMRNDPMFYRKEFFPCMASISDKLDKGKTCDPAKDIGPCVDKACDTYCNRYDLHSPKTLFPIEDRRDIVNKVYQEEIANLKAGMYKAESSCS